ncbi:MAG: quinone-interacting membrane-bound oxidoreductase complex subunit QmoC [Actinomycetota bacterium]|nr:quinone-interacting membrane-bound oxidoreductase complex subunit QmoC [Actinomycetota bacterium]
MSEHHIVEPDLRFIKDMKRAGGDSMKKCFQCATCSVVCNLTPDDSPFPRKEMIWAQWGQKDRLLSDPDVWLCHQCNDCSKNCPRGAKPGDVLGAVRNMSFQHFAFPRFMGTWLSRPAYLPLVLGIPFALLWILIGMYGNWTVPEGELKYSNFLSVVAIEGIYITLLFLAVFALGVSINRFWKTMVHYHGEKGLMGAPVPSLLSILPGILAHRRFKECDESKDRYWGHLGIFYGFLGAATTTGIFTVVYYYGLGIHSPYPMSHPVKMLGNVSALSLLVGAFIVTVNRFKGTEKKSGYYDWSLIILVFGLGLTGWATQFIRLADMRSIAYPVYFLHLLFVFYLFAYLPYSKMAHLAYRSVGMVFARQAQRDLVSQEEIA